MARQGQAPGTTTSMAIRCRGAGHSERLRLQGPWHSELSIATTKSLCLAVPWLDSTAHQRPRFSMLGLQLLPGTAVRRASLDAASLWMKRIVDDQGHHNVAGHRHHAAIAGRLQARSARRRRGQAVR